MSSALKARLALLAPLVVVILCPSHCPSLTLPSDPAVIHPSNYRIDQWNARNNSPFNNVNALLQSRDGYLWIGAIEGLYRFDGARFVSIGREKDPRLPSNRISALFEDSHGALWIGTQGGGLATLRKGKLTTVTSRQGLPSDYVRAIAEDPKGNIWVGTDGEGVCEILPDTIISYNRENSILDGRVTSVLSGQDSAVWVGTYGGLFRLKNGAWIRFGRNDGLSSDSILCLHETAGELWIGTYGRGVTIWKNGAFTKFGRPQGLSGDNVTGIAGDTVTGIWITTLRGGLDRVLHGAVSSYPLEGSHRGAFPVALARSTDGSVWAGMQNEGLLRLREVPFTWISASDASKPNPVNSVIEDRTGTLWLGSANGLERLREGKIAPTPLQLLVLTVAEGPPGVIWAGSLHNGLYKFQHGVLGKAPLPFDFAVWALYFSPRGNLWAGTNKGLIRIENDAYRIYTHNTDGLSHDDVRAICEGKDSALWVGTSYGLDRLTRDTFTVYTNKNSDLSNDVILALHADVDGDLWIGTVDGLNRLRNGKFFSFTSRDGLPDDAAGMILEDNIGFFWIASDKGLYRVRKSELNDYADGSDSTIRCTSFGKEDGLLDPGVSGGIQPAAWKSRDGRLYFPTRGGIGMIDPVRLNMNSQPPHVIIEGMRADRTPVDLTGPVSMSYDVNQFEIDYTAPVFVKPQLLTFKYRLEGLTESWTEAGTRRTAYFTHMAPGEYTFHVVAANEDGVWNTTGATLRIIVLSPFWMTSWFRLLVILAFLSLGPVFYFRRVTQLKRRHAKQQEFSMQLLNSQEAERKRIAAELHDSLGQNIIIIKNRALLGKQAGGDGEAIAEQLDEIVRTAAATLEDMRKIAHNLRPPNLERFGLKETLENSIAAVASATGIDLRTDIDIIDKLLAPDVEIHVFRIVQEALTNIARHSDTKSGSISIKSLGSAINMTIRDDGRGFDAAKSSAISGSGLNNISQRVSLMGGHFSIESTPGGGTTIHVNLPFPAKAP